MINTIISPNNTWALWAIIAVIAAISIGLEQKYSWANKLTGAIIALIIAMILSNLKIIPTEAATYDIVWKFIVPMAIPMLLFDANLLKIKKDSGRMILIYLISSFGTLIGVFSGYFMLKSIIPNLNQIASIITGSYTGGTVNLLAMSESFKVTGQDVSSTLVADNLLMAFYFFCIDDFTC